MRILVALMLAATVLGRCKYAVCDTTLPEDTCVDYSGDVVKLKQCASGKVCAGTRCIDMPKVKYDVGEKAATADDCYSGVLENGYCKGKKLDESCDSSNANKCDGGMFCDSYKCKPMKTNGSSCYSTNCESHLLCYPDSVCRPWFWRKIGESTSKAEMCETGVVFGGVCTDYTTIKGNEWITDKTDETGVCSYANSKSASAHCVLYSSSSDKAGHCARMDKDTLNIVKISAYLNAYNATDCPVAQPFCAKGWERVGGCVYKEALKSIYANTLLEEDMYPTCWNKTVHQAIDAIPCFSTQLIWGLLTVLAVAFLL